MDKIGILIKKAAMQLDKIANPILAPFDLTHTQYKILQYLYVAPPSTVRQIDLENFYAMTNPTVTGVLQNLEKKGWIRRDENPADKRSKVISLTEKAYAARPELDHAGNLFEAEFTYRLNDQECRQFVELLKKVLP